MSKITDRTRFLWDLGGRGLFLRHVWDEFKNRAKSWDITQSATSINGSLSNNANYVGACEAAIQSRANFLRFRSCKSYRKILEHVSPRTGQAYLNLLDSNGLAIKTLKQYRKQLNSGGPSMYWFPQLGMISPTSIRYAKVHQDISNLFGDISNFEIVEIGCGYGGMAAQILLSSQSTSYCLVDLPTVEKLALTYIQEVSPKILERISTSSEKSNKSYDLLISNYAFSELNRTLQDGYIEKYLLKSKRGYMIYNHINPSEFNSYTAEEICKIIPGANILPEIPLTDKTNVLIIWGDILK